MDTLRREHLDAAQRRRLFFKIKKIKNGHPSAPRVPRHRVKGQLLPQKGMWQDADKT
jgi:hypothetical protein